MTNPYPLSSLDRTASRRGSNPDPNALARLHEASDRAFALCATAQAAHTLTPAQAQTLKRLRRAAGRCSTPFGRDADEIRADLERLVASLVLPADIDRPELRAAAMPALTLLPRTSAVCAVREASPTSASRISLDQIEALSQLVPSLAALTSREARQAALRRALTPTRTSPRADSTGLLLARANEPNAPLRRLVTARASAGATPSMILHEWCAEAGVEATPALRRAIERLVRAVRSGVPTVDGRWLRADAMWSCPPLVQALILTHALGHPAATHVQIARNVAIDLSRWLSEAQALGVALSVPAPSRQTVGRFLARVPDSIRDARALGIDEALRRRKPTDRYTHPAMPNERWEVDHTQLDCWIRVRTGAAWTPVRPWLTTVVDVVSGLCIAFFVSVDAPDAFRLSQIMYSALTPWPEIGRHTACLPQMLVSDNGPDFKSSHAARVLQLLGIVHSFSRPYRPNDRPSIERLIGTLSLSVSGLPGYTKSRLVTDKSVHEAPEALLTAAALHAHLTESVFNLNTTVRRGETGTPLDQWKRGVSAQPPEDLIWRLLRSTTTRTVTDEGIEFDSAMYLGSLKHPVTGETHAELVGRRVRVYWTPTNVSQLWLTTCEPDSDEAKPEEFLGIVYRDGAGMPRLHYQEDVVAPNRQAKESVRRFEAQARADARRAHDVEERGLGEALLRETHQEQRERERRARLDERRAAVVRAEVEALLPAPSLPG